jgi:hypothetical protein
MFVREKLGGLPTPLAEVVTLKLPVTVLAVKVDAEAFPLLSELAVVVAVALANVPDAPEPGAVKVTSTPGTGFP